MPENNNAHYNRLNLSQRINIEKGLGLKSFSEIAKGIGVSPSTISREVLRNRVRDKSRRYGTGVHRFCADEGSCTVHGLCSGCDYKLCRVCRRHLCTSMCSHYSRAVCPRLIGPPYVCNSCTKKIGCKVERWIYDAGAAESLARCRLKEGRSGFDLDSETKQEVEKLIVPLIKAGQSIGQIYLTHPLEIPFSEKSLRTYIHAGVFAELTDFDLKRKVRYRVRKKREAKIAKDIPEHSYADFIALPPEVQAAATELDTVIGRVGGKCLLTLFMRSCSLMLIFLLDECEGGDVIEALGMLYASVICADKEFYEIFVALLSDRGSEFCYYQLMEMLGVDDDTGEIRTPFFYCDPRSPEQRPGQERNHSYIREYLPKGSSFDGLTYDDVCLMASHINSIPRATLGGKSPYQIAQLLYGKKWLDLLGIDYIEPDKVIRKPYLLGR